MKKMTFIEKVSKTIERLGGSRISESKNSDSTYYDVYGARVRVSDHFRCIVNKCTVNIVCCSNTDNIIVCVNNIPIVYKNMRELNQFLRVYFDCQRCNISAVEYGVEKEVREKELRLKDLRERIRKCNETFTKLRADIAKQQKSLDITKSDSSLLDDFSELNAKQQNAIRNVMNGYMAQNKCKKNKNQSQSSSMENTPE